MFGASMNSASDWGQPVNFSQLCKENESPKILIGRPFEDRGPPINLFNSTFSQFLKDFQNEDLDVTEHPYIELVSNRNMYAWTQELVGLAVKYYTKEGDRMTQMMDHLAKVLGPILQVTINNLSIATADGTIFVSVGTEMAWSAIFEGKNECGSTKDDPILQAAVYYLKYWSQTKVCPQTNQNQKKFKPIMKNILSQFINDGRIVNSLNFS